MGGPSPSLIALFGRPKIATGLAWRRPDSVIGNMLAALRTKAVNLPFAASPISKLMEHLDVRSQVGRGRHARGSMIGLGWIEVCHVSNLGILSRHPAG